MPHLQKIMPRPRRSPAPPRGWPPHGIGGSNPTGKASRGAPPPQSPSRTRSATMRPPRRSLHDAKMPIMSQSTQTSTHLKGKISTCGLGETLAHRCRLSHRQPGLMAHHMIHFYRPSVSINTRLFQGPKIIMCAEHGAENQIGRHKPRLSVRSYGGVHHDFISIQGRK